VTVQTIDKRIVSRIYGSGRGAVFTPTQFLDLGGRRVIDVVLHRLAKTGTIRRLTRGLYDYPKQHPTYGVMFPSPEVVAKALAGKDATRFQPSGAYAANLLGMSDQVPAKIVFLTDGRAKRVKIGRQEIVLKRTSPRNMATAGRLSGLVIQALRHIGKKRVDDKAISRMKQKLVDADAKPLLKDLTYAPAWIGDIMRRLAEKA
jgi:hypothetical protein